MSLRFPLLLVVDDDRILCRTLTDNLRADGYEVAVAHSAREALSVLETRLPNLAVVDLMLPDMHGFELCRKMKKSLDLPIIMLTAVDVEDSRVNGLELYAEDYVVKPFSYRELAARIGRVLKRTAGLLPEDPVMQLGPDLALNLSKRIVVVNGVDVRLSPVESRLLSSLARRCNQVVSRTVLMDEVWPDGDGDEGRLWVSIKRLRTKLGDNTARPRYIVTERWLGYKLVVETDVAAGGS